MSQPPYQPNDTQPGYWSPPSYQPVQPPSYPQQYGEQPYGAQPGGWQDQQYGYPGYDPYGQPPHRGNGMAVAGFVLSFFFGLLGLIFSTIGLRRSREPGRTGRGLAIAGIVISAVNILAGILIAASLNSGSTATDGSSTVANATTNAAASSSTPAPAPGSESVADACNVIIPALKNLQANMQSASSPADMINKINQLADTTEQQGVASGDASFTQHAANMADQYRAVLQSVRQGHAPDFTALAKSAEQIGYDCAQAGVTG